jgi:hypothetical protein
MERIKKIVWDEGGEIRTLKNVDVLTETDSLIMLRTEYLDFELNKRFVVKIERERR